MSAIVELLPFLKQLTPGGVGIWLGVLLFLAWWRREARETRHMSEEEKQARREGFSAQVTLLTTENRALRSDLSALEKKHSDYRSWCEEQHDKDRARATDLQDQITGLNRKLAAMEVGIIDKMPAERVTPLIEDMTSRVADHLSIAYPKDEI